jgi:hypothetical protein
LISERPASPMAFLPEGGWSMQINSHSNAPSPVAVQPEITSLDRYAFCQVPGFVHITAKSDSGVVG